MPTTRRIPSVAALLADINAFQQRWGVSDTQIGTQALRSHPFLGRVRKGRLIPRLDTIERLYRWMADYEAAQERTEKRAAELLRELEAWRHEHRGGGAGRAPEGHRYHA